MPAYSHFDYYLRATVTAMLALIIVGIAGWQVLHGSQLIGPFKDWAGIIIGVYFGSHVSMNGSGARRRAATEELPSLTVPVALQPTVVPVVPPTTPPEPPV